MPEDRKDRLPNHLADEAAREKEVEARRRATERAERLAISELLAWARRSRRRASRRGLLEENLAGLS